MFLVIYFRYGYTGTASNLLSSRSPIRTSKLSSAGRNRTASPEASLSCASIQGPENIFSQSSPRSPRTRRWATRITTAITISVALSRCSLNGCVFLILDLPAERLWGHKGCPSRPSAVWHRARPHHPDVQEETAADAQTLPGQTSTEHDYNLSPPWPNKKADKQMDLSVYLFTDVLVRKDRRISTGFI